MAFGDFFGGYCVLHAPFATAHRRQAFERELRAVGVARFEIVEARRVTRADPAAAPFDRVAELSLLDAFVSAIERARDAGWRSVAIFEDDVTFRPRFLARWAEVEPAVRETGWDVLTFYRWSAPGEFTVERPFVRTGLVPIDATLCSHALAVHADGYAAALAALAQCRAEGLPSDSFMGRVRRNGGRLFATSHNIVGQTSGLMGSSIQAGWTARRRLGYTFRARYGSYRSRLEYWVVRGGRGVVEVGRRLLRRERGVGE